MNNAVKSALLVLLLASLSIQAMADGYDPLMIAKGNREKKDFTVKDEERSREIPIRVFLPQDNKPAAVVLFSHGLGGSREGYAYLGDHWAARGYVCVFLQHPGSDDSVWKDAPLAERMDAMQKAASLKNFLLRVHDVPAVIDQLALWNKDESHPLYGRLDLDRLGMSGHSFGAVTTQAVSGQAFPRVHGFTDSRIKAAVVMSPSGPRIGDYQKAFGKVKIPWLLLTGTHDIAIIGNISIESRLAVFPALPPGEKFELVLDKAEHSAFSDRPLPGETQKRNPNHHRVILALTTAFWDAYLQNNSEAKKWLDGEPSQKLLQTGDKWHKK